MSNYVAVDSAKAFAGKVDPSRRYIVLREESVGVRVAGRFATMKAARARARCLNVRAAIREG
jgi:hypothetical protein